MKGLAPCMAGMGRAQSLVWGLLCMSLLQQSTAMFEEEAGLFDWCEPSTAHTHSHRRLLPLPPVWSVTCMEREGLRTGWWYARRKLENIGTLKAMVHPQAKSGVQRNQVFVITEQSALASINLGTGEINWRNTLPAGESFDSLRLHGKNLLTLSGGGKFVRVWNAADGTLEWDATSCLAGGTPSRYDAVFTGADVDGDGIEEVALLCDNSVQLRSGGALIWDSLVEGGKGDLGSLSIDGTSSISDLPLLTVAGRGTGAGGSRSDDDSALAAAGDELVTVSFDLRSGSEESYDAAAPPGGGVASGPGQRVGDGWYVSIGGGGRSLLVLDARKSKIHSFPTADLLPTGSAASEIWVESTPLDFHVVLHGAQATVLRIDVSGSVDVKTVHTFSLRDAVVASAKDGDVARVTAISVTESGTEAEVLSLPGDISSERFSFSSPTLKSSGMAQSARSVLTTKRDGQLAHRVVLVTADAGIHMLEPGDVKPKWVREEGLAEVSQAVFVDQIPMQGAAMDMPLSDLWAQIAKVTAQLTGGPAGRVSKERTQGWYRSAERFGLRKLGVVVSAVGKVYALDVNDGGRIVWSHYFGSAPAGGSGSKVALPDSVEYSVFIAQPTVGDKAARGVVVGKGTDSLSLSLSFSLTHSHTLYLHHLHHLHRLHLPLPPTLPSSLCFLLQARPLRFWPASMPSLATRTQWRWSRRRSCTWGWPRLISAWMMGLEWFTWSMPRAVPTSSRRVLLRRRSTLPTSLRSHFTTSLRRMRPA